MSNQTPLATYLYLFASEFLATVPKETANSFEDSAGHFVNKAELERLLLATTLFDLKSQGLIQIFTNGTVTFVKRLPCPEPVVGSKIQQTILNLLSPATIKLSELITLIPPLSPILKEDLLKQGLLSFQSSTRFFFIKEQKLVPNSSRLTALAKDLEVVKDSFSKLKSDKFFNELLRQLP